MLTIFRSNRADVLAQLLATQLRLHPPGPFEEVQVVVNTWPTSRWLGEQLAVGLGGIAANIRFPFPGSHLRRIVQRLLEQPEQPGSTQLASAQPGSTQVADPWRANQLVWPVLELLPGLLRAPEAEPLARWLADRSQSPTLDLAQWQMGRAIADAFDDYALYRPEMLAAWWRGSRVDGTGQPLAESQRWQPLLLAALRDRLPEQPFGLKVLEAIERLRQAPPQSGLLPSHLRLFGLSSLAPIQVQLLQALSGHLPIDLYLLTPCPDLWQRCSNRRQRLTPLVALQEPFAADWLLEAPGLEARFGRLGAEFQQLLEGTGESQLGQADEKDLFIAAADVHPGPGPAPLLAQLQQQLANPGVAATLERAPTDHSLEFHPCPGRLRQVQIVRDRLLQWLAADPSLQPRDILVMTPQVDAFAPLVSCVFGDSDATGVHLPWRLTDRSQQSEAGISRTLLQLLQLASERLTASSLESLLDSPGLQAHFRISSQEIAQLHGVLQRCGFHWGLDRAERGAAGASGSLSWAIDRLLLGLVLPETPGLAPSDTAPLALGQDLELVGRWLHLLTRVRHWLGVLRVSRPHQGWADVLQALLEDLFGDGGDHAWELPEILAAIDDWQQAAAGCSLAMGAAVVAAVLDERLAADSGRFGHRSGALTISALEPMRAIPHRVIVLMGLDASQFPRLRQRAGFHLMEQRRQLGDPHSSDQDRYVLMEALLSARDHLLVTWSSRDERKGEPLPPATPVRQWIEWLQSQLPCGGSDLVVDHPANPLDRLNFLPSANRPPGSCDRRLLEARRLLDGAQLRSARPLASQASAELGRHAPNGEAPCEGPIDGPMDVPGEDPEAAFNALHSWLVAPQAQWLEQLGLKPREWAQLLEDFDRTNLDERQRSQLLREAWDRANAPAGAGQPPGPDSRDDPQIWLEQHRGQGALPPGAAASLEARTLAQRWHSLEASLRLLGEPQRTRAHWQQWQTPAELRGTSLVLVHTAKPRSRHYLGLWLQLLLARAAGLPVSQGVLVARGDKGFGPMLHVESPCTEAAQAELQRLADWQRQWHGRCWPVPPQTGWVYAEAEYTKPGSGLAKAIACWEGHLAAAGEREDAEQSLCFGRTLAGIDLLDGGVQELSSELLRPLLEARR